MTAFIITGILMTVVVGLFMGAMFTSSMKDGWKRVLVTLIIAFAIGFGISGLFTMERKGDEIQWNNGQCECGGDWDLVNIEHLRNGGELYYHECTDCGCVIRLHSKFTK